MRILDLADLSGARAFAQSKTANILFAVEAARRWAPSGIAVYALHPGGINTGLDRYQGRGYQERLEAQFGGADRLPWKTVEQGAATSALLAGSPLVAGVTGAYCEDLNEAPVTEQPLSSTGAHGSGVAPYVMNLEHAARLWEASASLVASTEAGRSAERISTPGNTARSE